MILDTNALSAFAEAALGIGERMAGAEVLAIPVVVLGSTASG